MSGGFGYAERMVAGTQPPQSIDVTGLPEEAIRALTALVAAFRDQAGGRATPELFSSYEE